MYLLLVNPKASNNRYKKIERAFEASLERYKIKHKIVLIDDLINVDDLLKENIKSNISAVVAVGGNGTVASVIDALADYDLPFGMIPVSKSNHLAHLMGITSWQTGLKVLANHEIQDKRIGKIGQRYFAGSLMIAPRRNLVTNWFDKEHPLKKFFGANISQRMQRSQSIACLLKTNDKLTIKCQVHKILINLEDEGEQGIRIILSDQISRKELPSIFRANKVEIESSLNMPILSGNEVIANTPATIRVTSKKIPIIKPVASKSKKSAAKV